MHAKPWLFALALALTGLCSTAAAQELATGWNPRSGDPWVDSWLGDVNRYGARYPEAFIDEMVRYHNAPRPLVVELLETRKWLPGDVYYACTLAATLGRPCRYVVDLYDRDRNQGWGAIAQTLGVEPGSAAFHRLKQSFVPAYDRWARPIDLDEDLRRDFPDHGKASRNRGRPKAQGSNARDAGKPNKPKH